MRIVATTLVLAASAGLAACGGGTEVAALTASEYARQGNAICAEIDERVPQFKGEWTDLSAVGDFFDVLIAFSEEAQGRLRALTPPPELASKADELFAFTEQQLALTRDARDAAKRGDQDEFTKLTEKAGSTPSTEERLQKDLGWTECA